MTNTTQNAETDFASPALTHTQNAEAIPEPIVEPEVDPVELVKALEAQGYAPAFDFASFATAIEGRELEFLMYDTEGYAALETAMGPEWAAATRQRIETQRPAYVEQEMAEYRRLLRAQLNPQYPQGDAALIEPQPERVLVTGGEK
ncbi:hypothetical protein LJR231_003260 [Phyllobacterium sp. LjRoot231]|uniref:hypothetical protein n=1 Tax=Phyllobacterium sp. LjRoot231 TaxID=3342289 RepID=UPI003ECFDDDF